MVFFGLAPIAVANGVEHIADVLRGRRIAGVGDTGDVRRCDEVCRVQDRSAEGSGSGVKTSNAAPAIDLLFNACLSDADRISPARPALMR